MKIEWVVVEVVAVIIDSITKIYFLNYRLPSKLSLIYPQILSSLCLIGWGLIATFSKFSPLLYNSITYIIAFIYLLLFKHGFIWQKLFGIALAISLSLGSSLGGATLASMITNVSVEHTLLYQDISRLLAIVFIKTIQVILFFIMSKTSYSYQNLKSRILLIITLESVLVFSCLLSLLYNISEFGAQTNSLIIWLSIGLLIIMVILFSIYEMFVHEQIRNNDLTTRLHRLEIETHYFSELSLMYAELRTWRHEYKNNLLALHALIKSKALKKALEYIDKINGESVREVTLLQTGNTVLDAVVSSKLMFAQSRGIEVTIQSVYSKIYNIDNNDLCAIAGNLLDNAIEACERMRDTKLSHFISFSLIVDLKYVYLSILNSFDSEIQRDGNIFLSEKNKKAHGIGIIYVDSIISKYHGHVLRDYQQGVFKTHVMLPLISK